VRIGACNGVKANATTTADLCAFSKCFGTAAEQRLSSTSLVLQNATASRTEQPSTFLEEMNTKMQGRFHKTSSTSWPRCGHKTYPVASAARKYNLLKSCADIKRERAAGGIPDVIGALDDLSKTIDEQIVRDHHVTLIKVCQAPATVADERSVHGRLEYVKDLMSTDETSEESLKADEEVRSYMAAATDDEDCANGEDNHHLHKHPHHHHQPPSECENLKKLISTVKKNIKQSQCSQGTPKLLYTT